MGVRMDVMAARTSGGGYYIVSRSHYGIGVGLLERGRRAHAVHALLLESVGVVAGWLLSPTPEARWAASCTVRVGVHPLYVERTR